MNISPLSILRLATSRLLVLVTLFACALLPVHGASLDDLSYGDFFCGGLCIVDCDEAATGELIIPDTIGGEPIVGIFNSAFTFCTSLTSITIPDSVTFIGGSAFYRCTSLTNITIGNGVTSISPNAFAWSGVTSITFGANSAITSIENSSFGQCFSLKSITIPDSVTSIGSFAFIDCINLTSITIGDGVTSIGDYAFISCISLRDVRFRGVAPTMGSEVFVDVPEEAQAYVRNEFANNFGGFGSNWEGLTVAILRATASINDNITNCEISALRLPSGGLDALQVSFPARSGVSYRIEESSDLQVWDVRETGISGDGIIIQRRIPARGPKGFLRVVEE